MANYVYSTLTSGQVYASYIPASLDGNQIPTIETKIEIKGGANLIDPKTMVTPRGVATSVTDEELEILLKNPEFQAHKERGFIQIESKKLAANKVAAGMEGRDNSAQLDAAALEALGSKIPTIGGPSAE